MNPQPTTVCTLFEGHHHFGLGALANSLFTQGYRGVLWAGFRGPLPPWAQPSLSSGTTTEFQVAEGFSIRFLPLDTDLHFANYKPVFMLDVLRQHCPEAGSLVYFDPDIVLKCAWSFFPQWLASGIALCEDVNSPMPATHPIRHHWRQCAAKKGVSLSHDLHSYVNSGFVGLARADIAFLETWAGMLDLVGGEIGDLHRFHLPPRPYPFSNCDQDALNMALMSGRFAISLLGREGMDFQPGGWTMSHAIGIQKPWMKCLALDALRGHPPSAADKSFWRNTGTPIRLYAPLSHLIHRLDLLLASGISRFIGRA